MDTTWLEASTIRQGLEAVRAWEADGSPSPCPEHVRLMAENAIMLLSMPRVRQDIDDADAMQLELQKATST